MENIQKALQTLKLPEAFGKWNGQIREKWQSTLVEAITVDMRSRPHKTTTQYMAVAKREMFGDYGLNSLARFLHKVDKGGFAFDYVSDSELKKDAATFTIATGPFAGKTYWTGEQHLFMKETPEKDHDFEFIFTYNPFSNTTATGLPEPTNGENPSITILRETTIITATKVSKIKQFPVYTKSQLMAKSGMTEEQIELAFSTQFKGYKVNPDTHITSVSVEVTQDGNQFTGTSYTNGVANKVQSPSGKVTSYGKTWPGIKERWRLYNGPENDLVTGATWREEIDNGENPIFITEGTAFSFNPTTKVLTYDESKGATLWFENEEDPAQGKNFSVETIQILN